eukprot:3856264-Pyramimonas_sp.AAC.1
MSTTTRAPAVGTDPSPPAPLPSPPAQVSDMLREERTPLERLTLSSLLTSDVHSRDVTQRLQREHITDLTDFAWVSQLRHYWRDADGIAEMAQ